VAIPAISSVLVVHSESEQITRTPRNLLGFRESEGGECKVLPAYILAMGMLDIVIFS